jgi:hypothetical protein
MLVSPTGHTSERLNTYRDDVRVFAAFDLRQRHRQRHVLGRGQFGDVCADVRQGSGQGLSCLVSEVLLLLRRA